MSHVARPSAFHGQAYLPAATAAPQRRSFFRRLYDAALRSRERQTQIDIDRVVGWRDGGFNDRFEQEIAEKFYSDGWNFRR